MDYKYPITILTPTYNRSNCLSTLYNSLINQTNHSFQWLIIDDGSTDNTKELIESFNTASFPIDYYYKNNAGKHTAINYSHPYIKGEIVCIVDSDDWLLPDAIDTILLYKKNYFSNNNVKLMTFLRGKNPQEAINTCFPTDPVISNHIDFRINGHRGGDCCEVIDTEVLKMFPFPEHPGERFLGEGYLWNNTGFLYNTVYIPKVIYICEYLDGGLTKSGRKFRLSSPLGGMDNSNSFFGDINGRKVNSKTLLKEAMLFVCYGKFAGLRYKEIIDLAKDKSRIRIFYLLGVALFIYWKIKYN